MLKRSSSRRLQVESLEKRIALTANLVVDGNTAPVTAAQLAVVGDSVYFSTNNGTETQIRRFDGTGISTITGHLVFGEFGDASPHFLMEVGNGVMYGLTQPFFAENIAQATFQIWYAAAGSSPQLVRELPVMDMFGDYQPPTAAAEVDGNLLIRDAWSRYQLIDVEGDTLATWSAPVDQRCRSPIYGPAHADGSDLVIEASYNCSSFLAPLFVRADSTGLNEVESHPSSLYLPSGTQVFSEEFRDTGAFELFFRTSTGTERIVADGASMKPASLTRFGADKIFFVGENGVNGREPWITDGTQAGTIQLRDISGLGSSDPEVLGQTPRGLVFSAFSEGRGEELWITDGTPAGTTLLRDIRPGSAGSDPTGISTTLEQEPIAVESDVIYFWVDTSGGRELWVTNGTASGTLRVTNQVMVAGTELTAQATMSDGTTILSFSDSAGNVQVWRSNASPGGTQRIAGLPTTGRIVEIAASEGNSRTFAVRFESNEIWSLNLAGGSPRNVWSSSTGTVDTFGLNPKHITKLGNRVLFTTEIDTKSRVWIWDPGTRQLSSPGIIAMNGDITIRVLSDQTAIFTAFNTVRVLNNGKLSALGTQLLRQHISVGNHSYLLSSTNALTIVNDRVVSTRPAGTFYQLTPYNGQLYAINGDGQLVRFNGAVPTIVANAAISTTAKLLPGPSGSLWVVEDGSQIRRFDLATTSVVGTWPISEDLLDNAASENGQLFWRSAGGRAIRTIRRGAIVDLVSVGDVSSFEESIAVGNRVFWIGVNSRQKRSLWTSDGTGSGTQRLGLIQGLGDLTTDGQKLYFTGDGSVWESDGTSAGTIRSPQVQSNLLNATADELSVIGTDLFFAASDGVHGKELFRVSLTPGTEKPGDANGDDVVNFADFLLLSRDFGKRRSPSANDPDFDDDGLVGFSDFLLLSSNFNK